MTSHSPARNAMTCRVCGSGHFADVAVLWDELAEAWELSPEERAYIDRQQGTHCTACHTNLRSGALAAALLDILGGATLAECVASPAASRIALLEVNEAGLLHAVLARLPGHRLAQWRWLSACGCSGPAGRSATRCPSWWGG